MWTKYLSNSVWFVELHGFWLEPAKELNHLQFPESLMTAIPVGKHIQF